MAVSHLTPDANPASSHPSNANLPPAQLSRWQRFNDAAEDPTSTVHLSFVILTVSTCLISTANFVAVAVTAPSEFYKWFTLACVGLTALGSGATARSQLARRRSALELKRTGGDILAARGERAGQVLLDGGRKA